MAEPYLKEVINQPPVINERRLWQGKYLGIAFAAMVVCIIIEFLAVVVFNTDLLWSIIIAAILVLLYAILLYFLLEPSIIREVRHTQIRNFEKPVIQTIEKPIVKEVIVEKPVPIEHEVVREVEKPVYLSTPRTRLNIPKYEYVGSSLAKVYHKRTCRLGKLIKKKFKVSNDYESFFKKKKYRPCKMCIKKAKK